MSNEDDIFLTTFNTMIEQLKELNNNIVAIKKSVEEILPSMDGLGAGLTNANNKINDLNKKFDKLSTELSNMQVAKPSSPEPVQSAKKSPPPKKGKQPDTPPKQESEPAIQPQHIGSPQHPIFIDLYKKVNEATNFKEVGEILIESLEQIESSFSFSRAFYEIRRIGNSFIRKGEKEMPPKEKVELSEKILDWETRLKD